MVKKVSAMVITQAARNLDSMRPVQIDANAPDMATGQQ